MFKLRFNKFYTGLFSLLLISGCSDASTVVKVGSQSMTENEQTTIKTSTRNSHKVGEAVKKSTYGINITNVQKWEGNKNNVPKKDNVFLIIDAIIENTSGDRFMVSSSQDFKVIDDQGFSHSYYLGTPDINNVEEILLSGSKTKLQTIVQVPKDAKTYKIVYAPSWLSSPEEFFFDNLKAPILNKVTFTVTGKSGEEQIGKFTVDFSNFKPEYILGNDYKVQMKEYYPKFEVDSKGVPIKNTSNTEPSIPAFIFNIIKADQPTGDAYLSFVRSIDSQNFRADEINKNSRYVIKIMNAGDIEIK
ncbi:DUF4352 domain-containing protein [Paenibacillus sp. LMG 31456]|uniref:DUF4352 domain-containing protein n=2 Tax=Paenibacillus foliorum TaxID=2654974 RepID=A0A972H2G9_9BACL|nr:DUF4352 domain-containing protein [Paenibacillus foliorum]